MRILLILTLVVKLLFSLEYTKKEENFLKNHPVIYFSAMEYWPIDKNGNSIHTNFIKLLNKYGRLNIQPIYYKYWSNGFEAAKKGKTYGIMALSFSKERTKWFFYTPTYNYQPYYLIVLKNSSIKNFSDLKNKKVYIAKDSIIRETLKHPDFTVVYTKTPYKDLIDGKIDAVLTFYMPQNPFIKKLRTTKVFINKTGEEHIGISKKYPILYGIILKAMKAVPYEEIEKIKEKYYFNPIPPVTVITPKITLKELISPLDLALTVTTVLFLFAVVYYYMTKKYLHLKLKSFLLGIFIVESLILGLIVYEIVMFNYYSKKILDIKSRSFNELFVTDKIEESITSLNNEFLKKLSHELSKYSDSFKNEKITAGNLKVLNHTLNYYASLKFFRPDTLTKIANVKINLENLIKLQKQVLKNKAPISIYRTNFNYVLNQIKIIRNFIKNKNDKEIAFIQAKIKYQFIMLVAITLIFILTNVLLFIMIRKKIYKPIIYLHKTIQKQKENKPVNKKFFYNDEVGNMIKEFFSLYEELKKNIEELRKNKKHLENQVKKEVEKRIHQERITMRQSRLALMGEMINAIAHQWKQPLSIVKYHIYLLKKEKNENVKKIADDLNLQIEHMTNTIEDFQNFFKEKKQETFLISEVLEKSLTLIKDEFSRRGIKIKTELNTDFKIEGNPNEFTHMILNILNNAKEIFSQRGIKNGTIVVQTEENEDFYFLKIKDDAGGIKKEILHKIFDLNFTTKKNGNGLGLYLSHQIAVKHTGILYAKNWEKGAEFIFKIRKS